ncbi:MAG: GNAT family N-acetyltransferase, partial [Akkermansia sp.]|nr:GNAT family N-acetyltransferase [Akkermansia sp.]
MLVVERLKSVNDANFAAVWQLYEHAFPLSEQRPYAYQALAMQDRQDFVCLHLSDVCGFVGLLFYWNLSHCLYVEHLAIMEGRRGQGLGSRALRYVHSLGLPVVLEIEKVVDAPTHQRLLFVRPTRYAHCGESPRGAAMMRNPRPEEQLRGGNEPWKRKFEGKSRL